MINIENEIDTYYDELLIEIGSYLNNIFNNKTIYLDNNNYNIVKNFIYLNELPQKYLILLQELLSRFVISKMNKKKINDYYHIMIRLLDKVKQEKIENLLILYKLRRSIEC